MLTFFKNFWNDQQGQDLIEYALLITLISLAVTATMKPLAVALNQVFTNANTSLS